MANTRSVDNGDIVSKLQEIEVILRKLVTLEPRPNYYLRFSPHYTLVTSHYSSLDAHRELCLWY